MSELVSTNQRIYVNSVDLSTKLLGTEMADVVEAIDTTAMGATSRISIPGLIGHTFRLSFNQDYAAGSVDATLSGVVSGGAAVAVAWRPVNTTISTSNPEYQFNAFISNYQRATGSIGEKATCSADFTFASALTRDVTP